MQDFEWTWLVVYDDGSTLGEAEDVGWPAVEMPRVRSLIVLPTNEELTTHYVVPIKEGLRPIFFRRTRQLQINDPSTIPAPYILPDGSVRTSYLFATVFGWQQTIHRRNIKSLTWLFPDGSVVVADRDFDDL